HARSLTRVLHERGGVVRFFHRQPRKQTGAARLRENVGKLLGDRPQLAEQDRRHALDVLLKADFVANTQMRQPRRAWNGRTAEGRAVISWLQSHRNAL